MYSTFMLLLMVPIVYTAYNPEYCNYVFSNFEIFPIGICIYNSDKDPKNSTAIAYECLSSTVLRIFYWTDYGKDNCLAGSDADNYQDISSSTYYSTFSFYCGGYDTCAAVWADYSSAKAKNYTCAYGHQQDYSIHPVACDVCVQDTSTSIYYKWVVSGNAKLSRMRYYDKYCLSSFVDSYEYIGDECNKSVETNSSKVYDKYGYSFNYYYGDSDSGVSSTGSEIGGLVALIILCVLVCYCCSKCKSGNSTSNSSSASEVVATIFVVKE